MTLAAKLGLRRDPLVLYLTTEDSPLSQQPHRTRCTGAEGDAAVIRLTACLVLATLGCATEPPPPERSTSEIITEIQRQVERIDAARVREINANRRVIRAQCEMLRHLLPPGGYGVDLHAACAPYESGELAGNLTPVTFEEEPQPRTAEVTP